MAFNLTQTLINSHLVSRNMEPGNEIVATVDGSDNSIPLHHDLSQRQIKILMAGGAINWHDNPESGRVEPNLAQPAA